MDRNEGATLTLTFCVYEDADGFTAQCEELPGIITCSETRERLLKPMLEDAVFCYLEAAAKLGRLPAELRSAGFVGDPLGDFKIVPVLREASGFSWTANRAA